MNRVEHQRSILTTLGIDVWIPRVGVDAEHYIPQNYRDMAASEPSIVPNIELTVPLTTQLNQSKAQSESVVIEKNSQKVALQANKNQVEKVAVSQTVEPLVATLQIDAFDVQLYALEHCVLLVDVTNLNNEQWQLWRNIQASMQGREATLHWPFPLMTIQDGRGVAHYLQGFIDVYGSEKRLICLGEIPHLNMQLYEVLSNLQQMLEQPTLKRNLWQAMQAKQAV